MISQLRKIKEKQAVSDIVKETMGDAKK